jgi:DUF917 family protein
VPPHIGTFLGTGIKHYTGEQMVVNFKNCFAGAKKLNILNISLNNIFLLTITD